jgi:hypothetical protein
MRVIGHFMRNVSIKIRLLKGKSKWMCLVFFYVHCVEIH